ncbi:MAG: ATP-dependent RecD-like DNA helicase [Planctomycetota bacterium]|jgi:exodeoxyribonuclease V alpha subunit|nr:ATP-dependent RecD-like DNA helicase [Planctomycetota bacterium]
MDTPITPTSLERLTGLIERITFHSEETGFSVLKVKARGFREPVPVIGIMAAVTAGEWLDASGRWALDREHGRQFKAETVRTTRPDTPEGIERYLGSGLIKGIGPHFAKKLVQRFGKDIFDVIENEAWRLETIRGVGEKRRRLINAAWEEQKHVREIMVFLHSHGVGTSRAFRIYKTYGDQSIQTVRENPYRLTQDIWGIGFKTADIIAQSVGIAKDSSLRAKAGVEYVLGRLTEEGHCAYPRDDLIREAEKILVIDSAIVREALEQGVSEGRLVEHSHPGGSLTYLYSLDLAEELLARNLRELAQGRHPCPPIAMDKALAWVEKRTGLILAQSQRRAIALALTSKVFVLTGGPGTGKTTIVNGIVKILAAKKIRALLCAPTGRAAKRMSETSGTRAETIHRLLEFDPATGGFKHDREKPLKGNVFIVDEASMLDLPLAHQLIRAIPPSAALILVGDVDQLPSVGPGTVLTDIIESGKFPVCRLTEIFRQAAESLIVTNAHRVNRGVFPEYPQGKVADPSRCDFYFIEAETPEECEGIVVKLMADRLREGFGLDPIRDAQVLTPMRRGILGARNLNQVLQKTLNPAAPGIQRYGFTYRTGDKVMQIQNNYEKDTYNGDIGWIRNLDDERREAVIDFDNRSVTYQYDEFDELELSYAVTIHKSQGSEYPCVVMPLHTQHYMMLRRNLLYTGITRGKRLVVLVGNKKALGIALHQAERGKRITTLRERLTRSL